jgi:hypothetical protein
MTGNHELLGKRRSRCFSQNPSHCNKDISRVFDVYSHAEKDKSWFHHFWNFNCIIE